MTEQDLYYLRSILRQLREINKSTEFGPTLGTETLGNNIDWLDNFIDHNERKNVRDKE